MLQSLNSKITARRPPQEMTYRDAAEQCPPVRNTDFVTLPTACWPGLHEPVQAWQVERLAGRRAGV